MRTHLEEGGPHRKTNIVRRQVSWRNSKTHWDRLKDTMSAAPCAAPPNAGPNMIWPTIWPPGMAIGWLCSYGSLEPALSGHPSRQKSLLRRPRQWSRTHGAPMLGRPRDKPVFSLAPHRFLSGRLSREIDKSRRPRQSASVSEVPAPTERCEIRTDTTGLWQS